MNIHEKSQILNQIAQISIMERGKLCTYTYKDRSPDAAPHFKLQCWENGKNHTRYVRPEQVPLLEEALAGYARFQALTEQLAQGIIADTRQQLDKVRDGVKKRAAGRGASGPR